MPAEGVWGEAGGCIVGYYRGAADAGDGPDAGPDGWMEGARYEAFPNM